jgi:hypothetical protein
MKNGKQPAFNYSVGLSNHEVESMVGLTKREYFAGLAMQGILSNPQFNNLDLENSVVLAINQADELLKQLEL